MTVNSNNPNGFQVWGRMDGGSPTMGYQTRNIAYDNTNPIGFGDGVISLATGYIDIATASTVQFAGIFFGCTYQSTAVGRTVWSPNWPGSGAVTSSIVTAYIASDPQLLYVAQVSGSALTFADIDANVQIVAGTPNSVTGFSTASILSSSANTTATLPFRVYGLLSQYLPANSVPGTDDTSSYNRIIVRPNFFDRSSTTGIA